MKPSNPLKTRISVPAPIALAFSAAPIVTVAGGIIALQVLGPGNKTPFAFLDDFYPPAVEDKRRLKKVLDDKAAAEKAAAAKKAADEEAKAKQVAADKAAADAQKAAEDAKKAPEAKPPPAPPVAKTSLTNAKPPTSSVAKTPQASAKPPVPSVVETPPASAKPPAPPVAKTPPASAKPPAPPVPLAKKYEKKVPKYEADRIGPSPKPLPIVNAELAGKPGFTSRGEPSTPGALQAYRGDLARQAAQQSLLEKKAAQRDEKLQAGIQLRGERAAQAAADLARSKSNRQEALSRAQAAREEKLSQLSARKADTIIGKELRNSQLGQEKREEAVSIAREKIKAELTTQGA